MSPIVVYTALYGGYDRLVDPVRQDTDVGWICFTDDPDLRSDVWEIVVVPPAQGQHPRVASNVHKAMPHRSLPGVRWTIWIDANVRVDSPRFAREVIGFAREGRLAVFRHPQRDCIYDEARAILRLPRLRGLRIREQVAAYRGEGHPRHAGLYACGVIARDSSVATVEEFGESWFAEQTRWTYRDQLSFPVVARRLGVDPAVFPYHLHRHGRIGTSICRLHRYRWFDELTWGLRKHVGDRVPTATDPQRAWPRDDGGAPLVPRGANPWFELDPHRP